MSYASSALRRAPFVLAALAMTALTLGLTIVAPATLDKGFAELRAAAPLRGEAVASRCLCADPAWVHSAELRTTTTDAGCRQNT
ncbi:MAG: hypothetical protein ABI537_17195 [Casimicrobiaceae bacterium]